ARPPPGPLLQEREKLFPRLWKYPRLDWPDGQRPTQSVHGCSLSRRTGEGQGEGERHNKLYENKNSSKNRTRLSVESAADAAAVAGADKFSLQPALATSNRQAHAARPYAAGGFQLNTHRAAGGHPPAAGGPRFAVARQGGADESAPRSLRPGQPTVSAISDRRAIHRTSRAGAGGL